MTRRRETAPRGEFPQRLGSVLQGALKRRNISLHVRDESLRTAWNQAVGPIIAAQTSVDRCDRRTLFLKVSSPAWIHQLQFLKEELIGRLNRLLGEESVQNLYFSIGEVGPPKKKAPFALHPEGHPLQEREKKLIAAWTAPLSDPELAESVRRAITNHLIRRKMDDAGGKSS